MENKKKNNGLITILTFGAAFMIGDVINNYLGINGGGLLSINTVLSIIVLTICVFVIQFLVGKLSELISGKK